MKYIFIDMDNTIAENFTCNNLDFYPGMYLNKRPINIVIQGILTLYPDAYYIILSKTDGGDQGKAEKTAWLHKYFPYVKGVCLIDLNEQKRDYIKQFIEVLKIDPSDVVLIDDKKSILQSCSDLGIITKYPQQVICDYEEHVKVKKL